MTQGARGARGARSAWDAPQRIGYPQIQEVAPHPRGGRTLLVVREPLLTDERSEFLTHLYLAPESPADPEDRQAAPLQLTFGEHRNYAPRWSPDGRTIAFLSTRNGAPSGAPNVYAMRADGGEAWALTRRQSLGVRQLEWAPDGRHLALLLQDSPPAEEERAQKARDDARVWGTSARYAHLHLIPFQVAPRILPEPRRLTGGPMQVIGFDWLPDSRGIAFSHRPLPEWEHWAETRLATVTVDADPAVTDLGLVGDWTARPLVSPDGRCVACHTSDRPGKWALSGRVVLYPLGGAGGPAPSQEPVILAETPDGRCDPVCWSPAGDEVYALQQNGVTPQLWAIPASGAAARQVTAGTLVLSAAAGSRSGTVACVGQDLREPNAVYHVEPASGETRREARLVVAPPLPAEWPAGSPPAAEVVRWRSRDGLEIEGVLTYPLGPHLGPQAGPRPGAPCPLVVDVHGGPPSAFSRGYVLAPDRTADSAALAARGYAVLRPNPRGSTGYGRDFRFANYGDWGGGDLDDILDGVDWLIREGIADGERLGIAGWSYGGYLTAAAIARTTRFKGACVGAGITNAASFNGTSDIPDFIPDYLGAEAWDDPERYRRHSPVLQAGAIRTPTLILHGEEDERVPPGQGRELHNALRRRGVPVELVLYPRQGHSIGEPRLQLDARRRIVEWMERWV